MLYSLVLPHHACSECTSTKASLQTVFCNPFISISSKAYEIYSVYFKQQRNILVMNRDKISSQDPQSPQFTILKKEEQTCKHCKSAENQV